jgi:hypothetical protein
VSKNQRGVQRACLTKPTGQLGATGSSSSIAWGKSAFVGSGGNGALYPAASPLCSLSLDAEQKGGRRKLARDIGPASPETDAR